MKWTEEQVEIMEMAAKNGLTVEETSASLIEAGYENRTVRSINAKWRYMYKAPFGDFNEEELVIEEVEKELETVDVKTWKEDTTGRKISLFEKAMLLLATMVGLWLLTEGGYINWG
jgi:hypothetical protein